MATRGIPPGPFTHTAPGDLGAHRETMLENELLLRNKLALPKSRAFSLPGAGFTYGRPNEKRVYTAGDGDLMVLPCVPALRGWYGYVNDLPSRARRIPDRDFKTLNQCALSAGLVTTNEHFDYRANHDIRCKPKDQIKKGYRRFPPWMVFGMPSRPSTPIFEILEHKFQDKWITQRFNQLAMRRREEEHKKKNCMGYNTRAAKLRTFQNPVDEQAPWQMPRFAKSAMPHLETFRNSKAKKDAFENFDLDRVSRKGTLGQGVYEEAKKN
ncbi:cilia- and flagella-associated protein 77-like isoform X2 [Pomacea canaliculata]|uniref:cilia- and flagella-associated protein 77-like isoform X2 n=1 Tax=Pomacea canaliculata TaxID=400727 RepID=UPI000D73436E|nr:cilia- and flagella-associated protein 77-like isoform X2 [Pomacea canaliculata]